MVMASKWQKPDNAKMRDRKRIKRLQLTKSLFRQLQSFIGVDWECQAKKTLEVALEHFVKVLKVFLKWLKSILKVVKGHLSRNFAAKIEFSPFSSWLQAIKLKS